MTAHDSATAIVYKVPDQLGRRDSHVNGMEGTFILHTCLAAGIPTRDTSNVK